MSNGHDRPVKLRVIGDVHGHYRRYLELTKRAKYTVQLGDFGFDYRCLDELDSECNKIIPGNHDNYERLPQHVLVPFGMHTLGEFTFFYIRGAHSIDQQYRTTGITWWPTEQLTTAQGEACIKAFEAAKPDMVLSHDCPASVYPLVVNNPWHIQENWTMKFLEECLQRHQPRRWIFGHHHREGWTEKLGKTRFHCLGELEIMDFYEVPNVNNNSTSTNT